jgi:hypothetical protein
MWSISPVTGQDQARQIRSAQKLDPFFRLGQRLSLGRWILSLNGCNIEQPEFLSRGEKSHSIGVCFVALSGHA